MAIWHAQKLRRFLRIALTKVKATKKPGLWRNFQIERIQSDCCAAIEACCAAIEACRVEGICCVTSDSLNCKSTIK